MSTTEQNNNPVNRATVVRPVDIINKQITFIWIPGHTHVELIFDPNGKLLFAAKERGKEVELLPKVGDYIPVEWIQSYARSKTLRLPSGVAPYSSIDELAQEIREFIHRYFECDEEFESVLVAYVLLTWVYQRFQAIPYLRFLGLSGTGKTRASETIGAVCYRTITLGGSLTSAALFRVPDVIGGTMFIDEADFDKSGIGSDIAKILNDGYRRGLPVTRMHQGADNSFVPKLYDVFCPKLLNGRSEYRDDATESRCLVHTPRPLTRSEIPLQLSDDFEEEALTLQNKLLQWRFDVFDQIQPAEIKIGSLRPRTNEILMPLLYVANQLTDARYRQHIVRYGHALEDQALEERKMSVEGMLLKAYSKFDAMNLPTCRELADKVHTMAVSVDHKIQQWLTPKKVSSIVKGMGFKTKHTNRGATVQIDHATLKSLYKRYGIEAGDEEVMNVGLSSPC